MYDTIEEARQKLEGSIVLFDGEPVWITAVGGGKGSVTLYYGTLPVPKNGYANNGTQVSINDPRWNFRHLGDKLGYVNLKNPYTSVFDTVYLSRIPARHSRQGLDGRTVQIRSFPEGAYPWDLGYITHQEGLSETMKGKFPTAKEAFYALTKDPSKICSMAIDRKLMLIYDRVTLPCLVYRGEKIGYTENGVEYKLAKHKAFLAETLSEIEGVKIA